MPSRRAAQRARKDKRQGKSPSTQAGEFVREEIHKIRRGEHGARSPEQAIAIALSEARRAGVDLPPPRRGTSATRRKARYDYEVGHGRRTPKRRPKVAKAVEQVLKREPRRSASRGALARHARRAAARRSPAERSAAGRKAARTRARRGR